MANNMPNVPMNHSITTCRHEVDKEKFNPEFERIFDGKDNLCDCKVSKIMFIDGKMTCMQCRRTK